jgi:hypothetical protein
MPFELLSKETRVQVPTVGEPHQNVWYQECHDDTGAAEAKWHHCWLISNKTKQKKKTPSVAIS